MEVLRKSDYCDIYAELERIVDDKNTVEKIFNHYRGVTVTFPKKLYSKEYIRQYIAEHYGTDNIHEIARHLDLSERRVRQLAKEMEK